MAASASASASASSLELLSGLFGSKSVGDFPFGPKAVVEVLSTDTVDSAFRTLVQHGILSAPAYNEATGKYLGFFDMTDALALIYSTDLLIAAVPDSMLNANIAKQLASSGSSCPDCSELLVATIFDEDGDEEAHGKGESLAGGEWHPVDESTPMSDVVRLLANSTRRVPVLDAKSGKVTKIISQSLITEVLNNALNELDESGKALPELFSRTPRSFDGFGVRDVLKVSSEEDTAQVAFSKIVESGVSAVAVVDDDGKMLASITTKDVRLFSNLEEAALQRLKAERSKRGGEEGDGGDGDGKGSTALMDLICGDFVSMVEMTRANTGITMAPAVVVVS